jgi:hypothetical protein
MPKVKKEDKKNEEVKKEEVVEEVKKEVSDVVEVNKQDLDALLKTVERQKEDIATLYKIADKARLARVQEQSTTPLVRTFRIWRFKPNGKIVIATKTISNVAEVVNGRYYEDQRVRVFFEDGSNEELSYANFFSNTERGEKGEEVGRESITVDGKIQELINLLLEDGKKIKINKEFLN